MKVLVCGLMILLLAAHAAGQEIAKADLTVAPRPNESVQSSQKAQLPDGCKKILPGVKGDGVVVTEGNEETKIVSEILHVSNVSPSVGSELQAEVKLTNAGKEPIQVPWSTDPNVIGDTNAEGSLVWEQGEFEVLLRGQQENDVMLKSLAYPLYGSNSLQGSIFTIHPGEWVTALIKFRIEAEYKVGRGTWQAGKRQLLVRWDQARRERSIKNCSVTTGYFRYEYHQKNLPLDIDLSLGDPTKEATQR